MHGLLQLSRGDGHTVVGSIGLKDINAGEHLERLLSCCACSVCIVCLGYWQLRSIGWLRVLHFGSCHGRLPHIVMRSWMRHTVDNPMLEMECECPLVNRYHNCWVVSPFQICFCRRAAVRGFLSEWPLSAWLLSEGYCHSNCCQKASVRVAAVRVAAVRVRVSN